MLRKPIILLLFLGYCFALNGAVVAEIDTGNEDETPTPIVYTDPTFSTIGESPSPSIAKPMTFGAIALVIAIGGGILVRRNSN